MAPVLSKAHTDELYWLGRYTERVYTTIFLFERIFDLMIDSDAEAYKQMLSNLEISDIYKDKYDFTRRYGFDRGNPDSIRFNLERAYDNAMIMREVIGSESLSYIQTAIYEMDRAQGSSSPMIDLQNVCDLIAAFWGMTDDMITDDRVRNLLKVGKIIERIDLYSRMRYDLKRIAREIERLQGRIDKSRITYDHGKLEELYELTHADSKELSETSNSLDLYRRIVDIVEMLV